VDFLARIDLGLVTWFGLLLLLIGALANLIAQRKDRGDGARSTEDRVASAAVGLGTLLLVGACAIFAIFLVIILLGAAALFQPS
jgi:hypothetical protein